MEITEVRISRRTQGGDAKLKAYAAVTFDDVFVVRDLKIIEGKKGLFVAMPSQKLYEPCPKCKKKNPIRSKFCNECGLRLPNTDKKKKEGYRDIAHPVNSDMRSYLQKVIIDAFLANQTEESGAEEVVEETSYAEVEEKPTSSSSGEVDFLSTPVLTDEDRVNHEDDLAQELLDTID